MPMPRARVSTNVRHALSTWFLLNPATDTPELSLMAKSSYSLSLPLPLNRLWSCWTTRGCRSMKSCQILRRWYQILMSAHERPHR